MIKPFFAGLLISEIISFLHIYGSNTALKATLSEVQTAGCLVIPNANTLPSLSAFGPALCSALFFVLTAGALVSSISVLTVLLFSRITKNSRLSWAGFLTFWTLTTLFFNFKIFSPVAAAYTLLIPLSVMITAYRPHHDPSKIDHDVTTRLVFIIAVAVTGAVFYLKSDKGIFLDTRDYLLLGTRPGRVITDFYYSYSPYATEAIKEPFKKQAKACWIDPEIEKTDRLKSVLPRYGWYAINNPGTASLIIKDSPDSNLNFIDRKYTLLSIKPKAFFNNPGSFLKQYSKKTDKNQNLRLFCLAGLVVSAPLLLLLMIFASIKAGLSLFAQGKTATTLSGVLTVGVSLAMLSYVTPAVPLKNRTISAMVDSSSSRTRIQGLRTVCDKKKNIWKYPGAVERFKNGSIPEQYWLANALALTRSAGSAACLRTMIKDSSINVRCASIRALSRIERSAASGEQFRTIVRNSSQWYVQQAALNALATRR